MESEGRELWRAVYAGAPRPTSKGRQRSASSRPTSTAGAVSVASPAPPVPRLACLSNGGLPTTSQPDSAVAARPVSRSRTRAGQLPNTPASSKAWEQLRTDSTTSSRPVTRQSPYLTPPNPQPLPLSARGPRSKPTAEGIQQAPSTQATATPASLPQSETTNAAVNHAPAALQQNMDVVPCTAVRPSTGTGRMRSGIRAMAATQQQEAPPQQQLSPYLAAPRAAKPRSPAALQSRPGTATVSMRLHNTGQQQPQQQRNQQAGTLFHHSSRYGSAEQPSADGQTGDLPLAAAAPAPNTAVAPATLPVQPAPMQHSAWPPAVELEEDIPVALSAPTEHPLPDGTFGVTLDSYMGRMVTTPADRNAISGLGQSDEDVALAHLAQQQQRHASRPASHKAAVPPTVLAAGTSPFQQKASAAAAFSDDSSDSDDEILDLSMMDVDAVSGQVSRQPSEHAGRLSGQGAAWNQPPVRKASAGNQAFASARANSLDLRPATAAAAPGVRPGLLDSQSPIHTKHQQHQKQQLALLDTNHSQDFIKETSLGHLSASLFTPNSEEAGRLSVSGSQRELWGSYDPSSHGSFSAAASHSANKFSRAGTSGASSSTNSPTKRQGLAEGHGSAAMMASSAATEPAASVSRHIAHGQQLNSSSALHGQGSSSFMSRVAAAAAGTSADSTSLYNSTSTPAAAQGITSPTRGSLQKGGRSTIMNTTGSSTLQHQQQQLQPPQPHVWRASGGGSGNGLSTMPAKARTPGSASNSDLTPLFTRRSNAASLAHAEVTVTEATHKGNGTGICGPHSAGCGAAAGQVRLDPNTWVPAGPDAQEMRPPSRQKSAAPLHLFGDDLRDSLTEPGRSSATPGGRPQSAIGLSRGKPQRPLSATLPAPSRDTTATKSAMTANMGTGKAGRHSASAWVAHVDANTSNQQQWQTPAAAGAIAATGRPCSRGRRQHMKAQDALFPDAPTALMPGSCWSMKGTCPGDAAVHLGMGRHELPSDDDSDGYDF